MTADPGTGFSCAVDDKARSGSFHVPHGTVVTAPDAFSADQSKQTKSATADLTPLAEITAPATETISDAAVAFTGRVSDGADIGDAGTFSGDGIKITNLQATMTANRHVASPFAPAAQLRVTDDVFLYGPNYLSAKGMAPLAKRRPPVVGVGLSTAPSQSVNKSDTAPGTGLSQPASPASDRK